jgi:NAD(P)-dependent dehydrogenase (short-subunit alcohol dehydrogenase family)
MESIFIREWLLFSPGSSRGLGRAIVLAFARENVRGLVVNFKDTNLHLDDLSEVTAIFPKEKIFLCRADVTDFEEASITMLSCAGTIREHLHVMYRCKGSSVAPSSISKSQ